MDVSTIERLREGRKTAASTSLAQCYVQLKAVTGSAFWFPFNQSGQDYATE